MLEPQRLSRIRRRAILLVFSSLYRNSSTNFVLLLNKVITFSEGNKKKRGLIICYLYIFCTPMRFQFVQTIGCLLKRTIFCPKFYNFCLPINCIPNIFLQHQYKYYIIKRKKELERGRSHFTRISKNIIFKCSFLNLTSQKKSSVFNSRKLNFQKYQKFGMSSLLAQYI